MPAGMSDDEHWQRTYDARQRYFESTVGPLPGDILKMQNMMGVWPGGGLFVIPAKKISARSGDDAGSSQAALPGAPRRRFRALPGGVFGLSRALAGVPSRRSRSTSVFCSEKEFLRIRMPQ
jgi:hypothetical protein